MTKKQEPQPEPTCPDRLNLVEATKRACQESTLLDALTFICIWESERAIRQARENPTWETCFKVSLKSVFDNYHTPADLQPEVVEKKCTRKDTKGGRPSSGVWQDKPTASQMPLIPMEQIKKYGNYPAQQKALAKAQRDSDMKWLPEHDKAMFKAFAEECIKSMPDIRQNFDTLINIGTQYDACIVHIRATADKEGR